METSTYEPATPPIDVDALLERPTVSAGRILGRSFKLFFRNFIPFVFLSTLIQLPALAWMLKSGGSGVGSYQFANGLNTVLSHIATGAMSYGVFMQLRGQKVGALQSVVVGLKRLLPVLGVALLVGVMVGLGYLALWVPGIILNCMFFVAVPAAIVEKPGVFGALRRSKELTQGFTGAIFGYLFVAGLAFIALIVVAVVLLKEQMLGGKGTAFVLAMWGVGLLISGWGSVASAVTYHDLRLFKEGTQIEELTSIFE